MIRLRYIRLHYVARRGPSIRLHCVTLRYITSRGTGCITSHHITSRGPDDVPWLLLGGEVRVRSEVRLKR